MSNLPTVIAYRALDLLNERKALLRNEGLAFWVWKRADRAILVFDTTQVDLRKLNEDFRHALSTRLAGRRVVRTNSRGLYFQVAYDIPPMKASLVSAPLDLSRQPTPYSLPIGTSDKGDLWRSLFDAISVFVVGLPGKGKSAMVHGFIQALLHGGQTLVYAWDGKDNAEYLRYVGRENFTLFPMNGLQDGLKALELETRERWRILARSGAPNIVEYNKKASTPMKPLALVIDEVAEVENQDALMRHVKVNRAAGLFPIFATNDPTKSAVIAKSSLQTRISFKVMSASDSVTGLGRSGAQKLQNIRGRGLVEDGGRLVEFQSFTVTYPDPTEEGMRWLEAVMSEPTAPEIDSHFSNEIIGMAEAVRERWTPDMSKSKVSQLFGKGFAGTSWTAKVNAVIEYLTSTSTPKEAEMPVLGTVEG